MFYHSMHPICAFRTNFKQSFYFIQLENVRRLSSNVPSSVHVILVSLTLPIGVIYFITKKFYAYLECTSHEA